MTILRTEDYSLFKILSYNRDIDDKLVEKKKDLLRTSNKMNVYPVTVTKDMEIIDGQHRFLACKELGLPVYFIIDDGFRQEDLSTVNDSTNKWKLKDYIKYYKEVGIMGYDSVYDMLHKYDITCSDLMTILSLDDGFLTYNMRRGILNLKKDEKYLQQFIIFRNKFNEFVSTVKFGKKDFLKSSKMLRALVNMYDQEWFDEDQFFQKVEINSNKIVKFHSSTEYYKNFIDIYNWRRRDKVGIDK